MCAQYAVEMIVWIRVIPVYTICFLFIYVCNTNVLRGFVTFCACEQYVCAWMYVFLCAGSPASFANKPLQEEFV